MKHLFLISAASLFLFGCGTKYWVGNTSGGEIEVNDVTIAAGECEQVRVKGDFEISVTGVADSGQTVEGDWVWSGGGWVTMKGAEIEQCEEDGNFVASAADPANAGAAGTETGTAVTTLTGAAQDKDTSACVPDGSVQPIHCTKDGASNTFAELLIYKSDTACEVGAKFAAGGQEALCATSAECTKKKDDWVKQQTDAGYTCS